MPVKTRPRRAPLDTDTRPAIRPHIFTEAEYLALENLIFGIRRRSVLGHHVLWGVISEATEFTPGVLEAVDDFVFENEQACDQVLALLDRHDPRFGRGPKGGSR